MRRRRARACGSACRTCCRAATPALDASPLEKLYVVVEGEVTIVTDGGEATLGPLDSCRIAPGERRRLENRTNRPASILLAMPHPPRPA